MMHLFFSHVGSRCENVACRVRGQKVDHSETTCRECELPLVSIRKVNWKTSLGAALALVLILIGSGYLFKLHLQRSATEREAALLAQAEAYLESSLRGATAADADSILRETQTKFQLNDPQKKRLSESARAVVAKLPRTLTPDVQQRLEILTRDLYLDGKISLAEQTALDQFIREQHLAPQAAQAFIAKLTGRLDDSNRGVAQGRALTAQGRYDDALAAYQGATLLDAGNAIAWAGLGGVHALLKQEAEARSCYSKALSLDPENWLAHYNLGLLSAHAGDRSSAFQHLSAVLKALPASATAERREVIEGLLHEPALAELRQDPGFADLLTTTEAGGQR